MGYELRIFAMRMRRIFGTLFSSLADVRGEQRV